MPRDYAKEYKTYHGKPEQIKRRDARNKARAIMVKKGWYGKGMDYILIIQIITR
jgi:hypothetical protein